MAITPEQAASFNQQFRGKHEIVCQSSDIRCFTDDEYKEMGVKVLEDVSDCDILVGVKEVPLDKLIPKKTYLFFSHTIKKQPYNQKLLKEIVARDIRLIDYEKLYDEHKKRVVAFGRYAGIVGAYNAIWTYGKRYNIFQLRRASECFDLEDLEKEYSKVKLPPVKIALTGGGRVAKGSMEVLFGMGIRQVTAKEFRKKEFDYPVFCQLNSRDYHKAINGDEFSRREFHEFPERFECEFIKYAKQADILIAGAYWDPKSPRLFERSDMVKKSFSIKVIADITCDIEGSIPSTLKPSTIDDPVYDYHPSDHHLDPAFSDESNVTVMAVDNLPCELPRNASNDFGRELLSKSLPLLIGEEPDPFDMIAQATITEGGKLTPNFTYLQDYLDGKTKS